MFSERGVNLTALLLKAALDIAMVYDYQKVNGLQLPFTLQLLFFGVLFFTAVTTFLFFQEY